MVDFLVVGAAPNFVYKSIFPLLIDGVIWFGHTGSTMIFISDVEPIKVFVRWFTTLNKNNNDFLELTKTYTSDIYKKYDNFDAINVSSVNDIPMDYNGVMGVPVTFIFFWNPNQFEIIGMLTDTPADNIYTFNGTPTYTDERHHKSKGGVINGRRCYEKILIRRRK